MVNFEDTAFWELYRKPRLDLCGGKTVKILISF
jgi:hypothetical protein